MPRYTPSNFTSDQLAEGSPVVVLTCSRQVVRPREATVARLTKTQVKVDVGGASPVVFRRVPRKNRLADDAYTVSGRYPGSDDLVLVAPDDPQVTEARRRADAERAGRALWDSLPGAYGIAHPYAFGSAAAWRNVAADARRAAAELTAIADAADAFADEHATT